MGFTVSMLKAIQQLQRMLIKGEGESSSLACYVESREKEVLLRHGILDPLEMDEAKILNFAGQKKEFFSLVDNLKEWKKKRKNRNDQKIDFRPTSPNKNLIKMDL